MRPLGPSLQHQELTRERAQHLRDRVASDVLGLVGSIARRVAPPPTRDRVQARLDRLSPQPRHRLLPMLDALGRLRPRGRFIQIGSNDGEQQDPLRLTILQREWSGVMVEPVPYVFERLQQNYGDNPRLVLENLAIGPVDGVKPFYHLARADDPDRPGLPIWYDALGSFLLDVVLAHRRFIPDIDERIVELEVPCLTFDSLCAKHGIDHIDVLHTDTEGYDYEIMKLVDFERYQPTLVIYESVHLGPVDKQGCSHRFALAGYETIEYGLDTWAFSDRRLDDQERAVLVPLWDWIRETVHQSDPFLVTRAVRGAARRLVGRPPIDSAVQFPLSDDERRYFELGYDDRVALPPGASDVLQQDNQRLYELRKAYAAADTPATTHSMWSASRVNANIELAHFRGDNLYVWHYPEHPRAMALKLYVYLRHLQDIGGGELFERLHEDGAFGCWTTDVPGVGRVSRDLLDSISELLFLDRQLGILRSSGLRVLDIGAGYGRLAHRAVEAIPALKDYCCVDAVPESTFLCEYYLEHRAVGPTARAVPLVDVEALEPDSFDLAINVHSWSECTSDAVRWWLGQLERLRVPRLFTVPNEADGYLCRDPDGTPVDVLPMLADAGYRLVTREPVLADPALQQMVGIYDCYLLFERSDAS